MLSHLLLPEQLIQQCRDINNQNNINVNQTVTNPGNLSAGVGDHALQSPTDVLICSPVLGGV